MDEITCAKCGKQFVGKGFLCKKCEKPSAEEVIKKIMKAQKANDCDVPVL